MTLFPFSDNSSFSSPEIKEKKSSKTKSPHKSNKDPVGDVDHVSETDDSEKCSEDNDSDAEGSKPPKKSSTSTLLTSVKPSHSVPSSSSSSKKISTSSAPKPTSSSAAPTASIFSSGTSIAKNQAAESKRKARASDERVSSDDENDHEDTLSSEFEDSGDELDSGGGMTELKREIVTFFQTASIDELSLIGGCSVKKAQRIMELRPFDSWQSLVRERHRRSCLIMHPR